MKYRSLPANWKEIIERHMAELHWEEVSRPYIFPGPPVNVKTGPSFEPDSSPPRFVK